MTLPTFGLLLLTHLLGAAGGAGASALGVPLPWMIGSLFVTAVLTLAGFPTATRRV